MYYGIYCDVYENGIVGGISMPYSELIKNFERIRDYVKEFYVYGFKSRDEYEKKSTRSYDNERRRIESYLEDYMGFRQTANGKNIFLSIDSRNSEHNPLYKALKSKSFTNGDITLHFILLDILCSPNISMTLKEITDKIDTEYLSFFNNPKFFDISTVRKKIKEYISLGIIDSYTKGKKTFYKRNETIDLSLYSDALEFFSEVGPCGVIGSYMLDKINENSSKYYLFKHHYITHTMESEILCNIFKAISNKCVITVKNQSRKSKTYRIYDIIPLKIFVSVQNGRCYLMGYNLSLNRIGSYRLDYISDVQIGNVSERFDEMHNTLMEIQKHMWGISVNKKLKPEHIEFTVYIGEDEEYIYHRLEREKRCGKVERIDKNTARFTADIYDTAEILTWLRTFICRIVSMNFSNRTVENQFKQDIKDMYSLYNLEDK